MLINILLIHFDIIAPYWISYAAIDADASFNDIICNAYLYKILLYRRVSFAMCEDMKETIKHATIIHSFSTNIFFITVPFNWRAISHVCKSKINMTVLFLATKYH